MHVRPLGLVGSVLALSLAASVTLVSQSKEPWVGTWRLNVSKSTTSPALRASAMSVRGTVRPTSAGNASSNSATTSGDALPP